MREDENDVDVDIMDEEEDLTDEEVTLVIRKLINNKATGIDGIAGELIKYGGRTMEEEMSKILNKVWREERMPQEWEKRIYLPLHERDDRLVC